MAELTDVTDEQFTERRVAERRLGDRRRGYGEAGHLTLTGPEQEVVTGLLNQREAPPLMRRSILRKLTSRLHVR